MSRKITVDGNHAAALVAYAFTEVAAIYPITPSSPMAELVDQWAAEGKENLFGQRVRLAQLQSEAGAAGTMHGSLAAGALTTTFTASQGLLLMIPNLYKMVGELLPGVLHVSARAISTHALSIFGDHQDVMACRQTGVCLLASANPQEALDLGCVAHLSALSASLPFLHFFDGFRTSHEYRDVEDISYAELSPLIDRPALQAFRQRALHPSHPVLRGTAQNPDIYFQGREAQNPFFERVPSLVAAYLERLGKITGRSYKPFDYYGPPDAKYVLVAMGSVCDTIREVLEHPSPEGSVGLVQVRLYRPFSRSHFLSVLPKTVRCIGVLDRTKEPGAPGEPLYLDVCQALQGYNPQPVIVGGRYGLGSKDTTPGQILAVIRNLKEACPKHGFTIGITDDVTHTSLPELSYVPGEDGTISCKFWGLGSDGTVGANKQACQIIGTNTEYHVQGYFAYDSKKSGGTTVSHLRFGKGPIRSAYLVCHADYVACHNPSFLYQQDLTQGLKPGGIFVLNCDFSPQELDEKLPASLRRYLARNNIRFYLIDAEKIASQVGLGNRINMVMQAAFFRLLGLFPLEEAVRLLKESVHKAYARKGADIEQMNHRAIELGMEALVPVAVPPQWKDAQDEPPALEDLPPFISHVQRPMARNQGDSLPVSVFSGMEDGSFPPGVTAYEKRGIAPMLPAWQPDRCIQCGRCSYLCPHATIRLFLLDEKELARAPEGYETIRALGKGLEGYRLRVQISPYDCTGCGNCADICPAKGKALIMEPAHTLMEFQSPLWEFSVSLAEKSGLADPLTVKGSQLIRPLLEFHGACPGCGETPYIRLLTQLFGPRMMIANATGCSSIWGASAPSTAYTVNAQGCGPAWANSLFEDNAEYGYGMYLGVTQIRQQLHQLAVQALAQPGLDQSLQQALEDWLERWQDGALSQRAAQALRHTLARTDLSDSPLLRSLADKADYLEKRSFWIIGGDGWAYDIGFGGVDHVLSSGANVNLFVMDTEVYSNTGGQASKATPEGAVAKFAFDGKAARKKDLGLMAITYGDVYVAQIAMGADYQQTLRAMAEAESYDGPSLIIAYAPCISHGIRSGISTSIREEKKAVDCGYWHLYRYDPRRRAQGKPPFQLDSKAPVLPYEDFLQGELRYRQLQNASPQRADQLFAQAQAHARQRYQTYLRLSQEPVS